MPVATNETTPLLRLHTADRFARIKSVLSAQDQPSYVQSFRFFLFGNWWNILLLFIPLSFLSHHLNWDAGLRFGLSLMAIMPLAQLLGEATEQLSMEVSPTLGALLNAIFGNAVGVIVEVIVGIVALFQDELRIVQTSMLGFILSNILLVLGCSCFFGGLNHHETTFRMTAAQTSSSLMTLSCITLIIPAAYHAAQSHISQDEPLPGLLAISQGTSIILLIVYGFYLWFRLRTHAELFQAIEPEEDEEPKRLKMNTAAACLALASVTIVTVLCANYLVGSIGETAERYHIPEAFISFIQLPLVAKAADLYTGVRMARKGKMEFTIGISIGNSIQISALVVPLLVIIGWMSGHALTLFFGDFETIALFVSVLLVNMFVQDGKSNYLEGLMLIALYIALGLAFWVS